MSTKAVIRAWYNTGSQYIFWGVTQIDNPLAEYPSGGGYPAAATLSDFVLLDYDGNLDFNGSILKGTWDSGVSDGYAVYIDDVTGDITLGRANTYSTSRIIGIAYNNINQVVASGEYETFCDGAVEAGKPVFLSATTDGLVTPTAPRTSGQTQVIVGTTTEEKLTSNVDLVKVLIKVEEPIELEETIEI